MTLPLDTYEELHDLLGALCDGAIDAERFERLQRLLADDVEAQRFYVRYVDLHGVLRRLEQGSKGSGIGVQGSGPAEAEIHRPSFVSHIPPIIIQPTLPYPLSSLPSYAGSLLLSYLVATMVLGVGLLIAWAWKLPAQPQFAHQPATLHSPPSTLHAVVGRITGMVDCRWEAGSGFRLQNSPRPQAGEGQGVRAARVPSPLSPVSLGDKFALASGLLEITYDTGAKVILQGPVTYAVESSAGGFLSVGKLTARVESGEWRVESSRRVAGESEIRNLKSEISNPQSLIPNPSLATGHWPLFTIKTPTAVVTDLGTEFGVEVARSGETTSHVFRGVIRVQAVAAGGQTRDDGRILRENESVRVESGTEHRIVVGRTLKPSHFVREISKRTIKTLDLVDVVAGGDGFTRRRNRGIDPTTGQIADDRPLRRGITGDHKYHRVGSLPFVDGVFLPDGGNGPVKVDSAGHTFDGFGKTDNNTVGPVWAGPVVSVAPDPPEVIPTDLGGVDYASPGHGLLFINANKGITFDLEAIRRASPGSRLVRFRAVAGNREDPSLHGEYVCADIWVLVDGQMRFQRREVNSTQGVFQISIPIGERDRFLTLAATDGGNGVRGDWIMFGDPRLEIVGQE